AVIVPAVLGIMLGILAAVSAPVSAAAAFLQAALGIGALVAAGLLLPWAGRHVRETQERHADEDAEQDDHARRLLGRDCACEDEAVAYLGWYGSIHTFVIASPRYAHLFQQANLKKLV
ncbi:MAG: hypothetical protein K2W96_18620, partial [Gemmataceae bacterium]|nr:hypothetical protein [Gemmataceae bacterium]